jgi:AraC-like DNA-binding protein
MLYQEEVNNSKAIFQKHIQSLQTLTETNEVRLKLNDRGLSSYHYRIDEKYLFEFLMVMDRVMGHIGKQQEIMIHFDGRNRGIWCYVDVPGLVFHKDHILTRRLDIKVSLTSFEQSTRIIFHYPKAQEGNFLKPRQTKEFDILKGLKPFYQKFRKELKSYYSTVKSLQDTAREISPEDGRFLENVNIRIMANLDNEKFDVYELSRSLAISRTQLFLKLKPLVKRSPGSYIRYVRLLYAKEQLENTQTSIGDVAHAVGYKDQSHFTRAFKRQFGYLPSYYRQHFETKQAQSFIAKSTSYEPGRT